MEQKIKQASWTPKEGRKDKWFECCCWVPEGKDWYAVRGCTHVVVIKDLEKGSFSRAMRVKT